MIGHFPEPEVDELLYSVLARCKTRLCERELRSFCFQMFGYAHARAKIDLPDRLEFLSQQIPCRFLGKPEAIAQELTLLPYYRPFLSQHRFLELQEAMLRPGQTSRIIPSLSPLKLGRTDCLRFCWRCWQEDSKTELGERYWRKSHQAPGCLVCSKHAFALHRSPVLWTFRESWQDFIDATKVDRAGSVQEILPGKNNAIYKAIADDIHWLLNGDVPKIHIGELTRTYWLALAQRRLTSGTHVHIGALRKLIVEEIGRSALRQFRSEVKDGNAFDWIGALLRPSRVSRSGQSPLRHLLLIRSLGFSVEEFFTKASEAQPLRRIGTPLRPETAHDETHLEQKISTWWRDPKMSCNEMARRLKISTNKLSTVAVRLNLTIPRGGKWGSKTVGKGFNATATEFLRTKRDAFLALRHDQPDAGMKELSGVASPLIRWLRHHDCSWLAANKPPAVRLGGAPRLDWSTRDANCAGRIPETVRTLLSQSRPLSVSAVQRVLKVRIDMSGDRMPKTKNLLTKVLSESQAAVS